MMPALIASSSRTASDGGWLAHSDRHLRGARLRERSIFGLLILRAHRRHEFEVDTQQTYLSRQDGGHDAGISVRAALPRQGVLACSAEGLGARQQLVLPSIE